MAVATIADFIEPNADLFRISVDQYHTMINQGVFADDDKVELLEGVLVRKMPKNAPHCSSVDLLRDLLPASFPSPEWVIRSQDPITLADSEPEPDLVLAKGPRRRYFDRHPMPEDILLVVESSDSSLSRDTLWKRRIYAKAGIGLYWVMDLPHRRILTFADPVDGDYQTVATYEEGQTVPLQGRSIRVDDLLPGE